MRVLLLPVVLLAACEPSEKSDIPQGDECRESEECDDGVWCNGAERCRHGVCFGGLPPDCDDGNLCTTDRCVEETMECDSEPDDSLCAEGFVCGELGCLQPE